MPNGAGVLRRRDIVDKSWRPDDDQRETHRQMLHAIVDLMIDSETQLRKQIKDFGGEFPAGGEGGLPTCDVCGGSGVTSTGAECDCAGPVTGSITERRALLPNPDLVAKAQEALAHTKETVAHMVTLRRQLRNCIPEPPVSSGGEEGCTSHTRLKDSKGRPTFEIRFRGQRCRWCYDFYRNYGCDPAVSLLDARAQGRLITQQMIDATFHKPKKK